MGPAIFVFSLQHNDSTIHNIQESTRGLKQGPVGKNLSATEKRKFLVNTVSTERWCCLFILYRLIILHQIKA
jgi:hypothetical protein